MTINSRVARSVRDMRSKLRDLAAAEHGAAASKTAIAAAHVDHAHACLEDSLDEAEHHLTAVTNVHQLADIGGIVASHRAAIDDAVLVHLTASEIADLSAARLRARTRQLKTSERVVENVRHARARAESKSEQGRNDDLTTARRR
jgi:hypothetical protein